MGNCSSDKLTAAVENAKTIKDNAIAEIDHVKNEVEKVENNVKNQVETVENNVKSQVEKMEKEVEKVKETAETVDKMVLQVNGDNVEVAEKETVEE